MANSHSVAMQLMRRALLQNTALVEEIGSRVYLDHFYSFETQNTVLPAVIIDPRGGRTNPGMAYQRLQIDVYVYAKHSSGIAEKIYDLVYQSLNAARLYHADTSQGGSCHEIFRPLAGYNNEVKAYFRRATYAYNGAG